MDFVMPITGISPDIRHVDMRHFAMKLGSRRQASQRVIKPLQNDFHDIMLN